MQHLNKNTLIIALLRIAVFGIFLGHGLNAILVNPSWIHLITTFGFSENFAIRVMPLIGTLDVIIAFSVLIYPLKPVLIWVIFWTFATALSRPLAGESFLEFAERTANWVTPLVLYLLMNPKKNGNAEK